MFSPNYHRQPVNHHHSSNRFIRALNTIDNTKLIDKLYFYGIEGNELEIFKSFLSKQTKYVQINTSLKHLIIHHAQSYKDQN